MESRSRSPETLGRATDLVVRRGRVYTTKAKYVSLVVYTTDYREANYLCAVIGGHWHPHRHGYVWVLAKHSELVYVLKLTEQHAEFHDRLKKALQSTGRSTEEPIDVDLLRKQRRGA